MPEGAVYVSGKVLAIWELKFSPDGNAPPQMHSPHARGRKREKYLQGNVYVADFYNHRIQVFDSEGKFLSVLGSEGGGDGQLHYPTDVAFDGEGNIYVADAYNYRVQKWASDGRFLAVWGGHGSAQEQFDVPSGIAVDGNGVVHIADSANHRIVGRNVDGKVLAIWELSDNAHPQMHSPTRVAASGKNIYVVDTANHRILALSLTKR